MGDKIPGKLLRAARELLDWDQPTLADKAGCSLSTITRIERGRAEHLEDTRQKIVDALEAAGVTFLAQDGTWGAGVRWTTPAIQSQKTEGDSERKAKN